MTYGYARCSTNEDRQDIDRQLRELEYNGAQRCLWEYEHGDARQKKQLDLIFELARPGDTLIVTEVSRLSRSTQQLCQIIEKIQAARLRLEIIGSITIDCRSGELDPMTAAFMQMAGVFAELELKMIRARVRSGMENARAKGAQIGRPRFSREDIPAVFYRHWPDYKMGTLNATEYARVCGVSRTTLYRYIAAFEPKKGAKK